MKKDCCQYVGRKGRCSRPACWVHQPTDGKLLKLCTYHRNKAVPEKETFENSILGIQESCKQIRDHINSMRRFQKLSGQSLWDVEIKQESKRLRAFQKLRYVLQLYYKKHFKEAK